MHMSHILVLSSLLFTVPAVAAESTPEPNADLSPQEVVQIVIQALKENDAATDAGIATVFRFASPGNKASTGPLERFSRMIKHGFSDMLNHIGSRTEAMKLDGHTALQPVYLTTQDGKEVGYLFQIGQQKSGPFEGMWMTEAVYPLPSKGQSI